MRKSSKEKRSRIRDEKSYIKFVFILLFAFLFIYAVSIILMLSWGFLTSLKSHTDFGVPGNNVIGFPDLDVNSPLNSREQFFNLSNYTLIFGKFKINNTIVFFSGSKVVEHRVNASFIEMVFNSIIYSCGNAIIQSIVPAVMGYACAKYKNKFSSLLYITSIVVMSLPIVGAYPSEITLLRNLGLYDTIYGNFIQRFSFTGMYFLVFYEYFDAVSDTYQEAASIDGASQFKIMSIIYLPLAMSMLGSVFLIKFIYFWNDYLVIKMYLPTFPTLSYSIYWMIYRESNYEINRIPIKVAACMILAVPTLILFVVLRDKLFRNMTLGGIKE